MNLPQAAPVGSVVMRIGSLVLGVVAIVVVGCGAATTTASPEPSGSASPEPSGSEALLLGPWRPAPLDVSEDLLSSIAYACRNPDDERLRADIKQMPMAVVDARGSALATAIFADDHAAFECRVKLETVGDALGATILEPPSRLVPDAVDPIADDAIRIVGYSRLEGEDGAAMTQLLGRVGRHAFEVIPSFDDESEVYSARANGWFSAWWPGAVDAATVGAVDRKNLVISGVPIPDTLAEPRADFATWWLDPAREKPGPEATTIPALIVERACASGKSPDGRLLPPQVFSSADAILVTVWVVRRPGGQDCQGNPPFAIEIELTEPLGDRKLLDGSEVPPRDATVPGS